MEPPQAQTQVSASHGKHNVEKSSTTTTKVVSVTSATKASEKKELTPQKTAPPPPKEPAPKKEVRMCHIHQVYNEYSDPLKYNP